MKELRSHVGLVFQYPEHQLFEVDVFSDVCFGPKNLGLPKEEIEKRAKEALDMVGLDESFYKQSPFDLSGGQKRRVAIAGVLAMKPEVLILDEPTAGLDPKGRDDILGLVQKLHNEQGLTIILVSHSMEDVARYVSRLVVMNHGEKVFDGTPKEVFRHYKELEAIGLAAPQITYVVHKLIDKGIPLDPDITTVEEWKKFRKCSSGKRSWSRFRERRSWERLRNSLWEGGQRRKDSRGGKDMLRDITLGQYYPVDSLLHRLDPRTKLFGTLVYIVSLFIADNLWAYLAATIFLITAIKLSNVPVKFMVRGLKSIMFLLLLSVSFNLFLTPGTPIFKIGFLQMTWEGLRFAAFMAIRLVYLVMGSTILTLTTTPNQLTDGLEKSLGFLKKVGVPVHEVSMMMSIALRFIPILIEETDKIMKAQMARGADFESGNLIQKAKSMVPLLVPLFVSAFRRATDLAMAMEARCYRGGEGRTKMKPLKYAKRDHMVYGAYLVYFVVAILLKVIL